MLANRVYHPLNPRMRQEIRRIRLSIRKTFFDLLTNELQ